MLILLDMSETFNSMFGRPGQDVVGGTILWWLQTFLGSRFHKMSWWITALCHDISIHRKLKRRTILFHADIRAILLFNIYLKRLAVIVKRLGYYISVTPYLFLVVYHPDLGLVGIWITCSINEESHSQTLCFVSQVIALHWLCLQPNNEHQLRSKV